MGVGAGHYWGGRRREEATRGEESRRGWWVAGYRLPSGKHTGILTEIQTKVNKKTTKILGVFGCRF